MNFEMLRDEAQFLKMTAESIAGIFSASAEDDEYFQGYITRIRKDCEELVRIAELTELYAVQSEKTEEDIMAFMRGKLSVNDQNSLVGDIIIEKDIEHVRSSLLMNRSMVYDKRIAGRIISRIFAEYGEHNE